MIIGSLATPTALAPAAAATAPGVGARRVPNAVTTAQSWPMAGGDLQGSHDNPAEHAISAANVDRLTQKWAHAFPSFLTATPTVVGSTA